MDMGVKFIAFFCIPKKWVIPILRGSKDWRFCRIDKNLGILGVFFGKKQWLVLVPIKWWDR